MNIGGEVVEFRRRDGLAAAEVRLGIGVVADEFPIAAPDGHLFAEAPVEHVVRRTGFAAGEKRQQIYAFQFPLGFGRDTRCGERAQQCGISLLILVGDDAAPIGDGAQAAGMPASAIERVATPEQAGQRLRELLTAGDVALLKASRAVRLEKVLGKLEGVSASVNFASEQAQVRYQGGQDQLQQIQASISKAGFSVPQQQLQLDIHGMTCAACAVRLEKVLNKLPGMTAQVNFATSTASMQFPSGVLALAVALYRRRLSRTLGLTARLVADGLSPAARAWSAVSPSLRSQCTPT